MIPVQIGPRPELGPLGTPLAMHPWLTGLACYAFMVGGTVAVALIVQGGVGLNNPGMYLGDIVLSVLVVMGGYALYELEGTYWFNQARWQWGLIPIAWVAWGAVELASRHGWHGVRQMNASDVYHWFAVGPYAALVFLAMFALYTAAFVERLGSRWIVLFAVLVVGLLVWAALALLTAQQHHYAGPPTPPPAATGTQR